MQNVSNIQIIGDPFHIELYNLLEKLNNSIGEKLNEYHWREFCGIQKEMEDRGLIKIKFNVKDVDE